MNCGYEKNIQEMRWRSDLRDDVANGHLAAKRVFEGTGVDEEECLSEVLGVSNGATAGKVKLGWWNDVMGKEYPRRNYL